MNTKLDHYDLKALVNRLYFMRSSYDINMKSLIDTLILRLTDIYNNTEHRRKVRVRFSDTERHIIIKCLADWRNQFLREGKPGAAKGVGELLVMFIQ